MYDGPLSVIATRCHLSPRRGSLFLLKSYFLAQPIRMLAAPFRLTTFGPVAILRPNFNVMKNGGGVILAEWKGPASLIA